MLPILPFTGVPLELFRAEEDCYRRGPGQQDLPFLR